MNPCIIPLCDFKYAGEIYSGATFKYDTAEKISKTELKLFSKSSKEIEKGSNKLLAKSISDISKNHKKYLSKNIYEVENKNFTKRLKPNIREINKKYYSIYLKSLNVCFIKYNSIQLNHIDVLINMDLQKSLCDAKGNEFNLQENKNLNTAYGDELSMENYKNLSSVLNNINLELGKQVSRSFKNEFNIANIFSLTDLTKKNLLLNKFSSVYLNKSIQVFNKYRIIELGKDETQNIDKFESIYFNRNNLKQISLDLGKKLYKRYSLKDIFKDNYKLIDKVACKNIDAINCKLTLRKNISKNINKDCDISYLNKCMLKNISRNIKMKLVSKANNKSISKSNIHGLDKIIFRNIFKDNYKLLRKIADKNIYRGNDYIELIKQKVNNIAKTYDRYLKSTRSINIYRQVEKELFDLTITDIAQIQSYYLENYLNREIHKEGNNKFIEITKRWWWLNPTDPRDNLIIPNKDFEYGSDLLNNSDYEYLRFTNHPISWGSDWGIDFNVPAYGVSIEIMLDLVNILIMAWHSNVQAWMCCSGKESMQFLMELLYDWYTLDTSKPNVDYYRVYRWIRWEAEKVYFLNLDTGLQAIGILIANLINYLKNHEFNLVPLWRNPKAMDIERNFNRMAQNGDLMKVLDKAKGKRYYYIETQNIEKKNILRR